MLGSAPLLDVFPISTRMRKMTLISRRSEVMMHQIMRVRVARLRADLSIELLENFVSDAEVRSVFLELNRPMIATKRVTKDLGMRQDGF